MKKHLKGILFLFLFLLCSFKKEELPDFETLMGLNIPSIATNVRTPEDFNNIRFFKENYERYKDDEWGQVRIPKVIHFLWLGAEEPSKEVMSNIKSWIKYHPRWQIKLWTDKERKGLPPSIEVRPLYEGIFTRLKPYFDKGYHLAEKADLLRYEILYQQGGVFIDLGMKCNSSLDPLNESYDFYVGLRSVKVPILSSSISVSDHIIAANPLHPIINCCIERIVQKWDKVGAFFPRNDLKSVRSRMVYRGHAALDEAVKAHLNDEGELRNVVLPSGYFFKVKGEFGEFSQQALPNPLFLAKTETEKRTFGKLEKMTRNNRFIVSINIGIFFFNLLAFILLIFAFRYLKKKKRVKAV